MSRGWTDEGPDHADGMEEHASRETLCRRGPRLLSAHGRSGVSREGRGVRQLVRGSARPALGAGIWKRSASSSRRTASPRASSWGRPPPELCARFISSPARATTSRPASTCSRRRTLSEPRKAGSRRSWSPADTSLFSWARARSRRRDRRSRGGEPIWGRLTLGGPRFALVDPVEGTARRGRIASSAVAVLVAAARRIRIARLTTLG